MSTAFRIARAVLRAVERAFATDHGWTISPLYPILTPRVSRPAGRERSGEPR